MEYKTIKDICESAEDERLAVKIATTLYRECWELDRKVEQQAKRIAELQDCLREAADTLEGCRYSEQPMAKKCRSVLAGNKQVLNDTNPL